MGTLPSFDDDEIPFGPLEHEEEGPAASGEPDLASMFADRDDELEDPDEASDEGEWRALIGLGEASGAVDRERRGRLQVGLALLGRLVSPQDSEAAAVRLVAENRGRLLSTFFPQALAAKVAMARRSMRDDFI